MKEHIWNYRYAGDVHIPIRFSIMSIGMLSHTYQIDEAGAKRLEFYGEPPHLITMIAEAYVNGWNHGLLAKDAS